MKEVLVAAAAAPSIRQPVPRRPPPSIDPRRRSLRGAAPSTPSSLRADLHRSAPDLHRPVPRRPPRRCPRAPIDPLPWSSSRDQPLPLPKPVDSGAPRKEPSLSLPPPPPPLPSLLQVRFLIGTQNIQAGPMADNHIRQALLADNPNVLQRKSSEVAKRFRRCRTTPRSDTSQKPDESGSRIPVRELFKVIRPSFRLVGFLLFVYLLVGSIVFYLFMDQISGKRTTRALDALYFCIVTMTSVGYGDLVPSSDTTKLLACAFVFSGMAIIALFVSKTADYLVEKQEVLFFKAMHMDMKCGEAKMLREIETNKVKYKLYTAALLLVTVIVAGTVFLWKVEKLSLVDSFYCVCATITTLGYGDKSFSSKLGRIFAVFWIITGTIIVALFFMYLAEIYTEQRQKVLAKWVLTRRMTTMDLEAADLDNDHQVGAAEFVLYKLKELGKISQEDISSFLEEFDKLDADQSGTLSANDLNLAQVDQ